MKTIRDIDIKDKIVLVRTDYNVPMENGKITSDLRIRASLPTLNYLLENGAKKIVIISHLGRPDGKPSEEFSLAPVAKAIEKLLPKEKVEFKAKNTGSFDEKSRIALLENLRFDAREEENSEDYIKEIVDFVKPDFFVQDGFAVVHRAHASTSAVAEFLPVYAGLLVEKEVKELSSVLKDPEHPFVAVIGGSKVDDKAPLIKKFLGLADKIIVGGKIAADGYTSEDEKIYVAEDFDENIAGEKLDVGPLATIQIAKYLEDAKTIVWNGLLGKAEDPAYATASILTAEIIGRNQGAKSVICGGDTTGFVEELMKEHKDLSYSLISTGGGAALEYLSGKNLPGLAVIEK